MLDSNRKKRDVLVERSRVTVKAL